LFVGSEQAANKEAQMTVPWEDVRAKMMQDPEVRAEYHRLCKEERQRQDAMPKTGKRRRQALLAGLIGASAVGRLGFQPFMAPSEKWSLIFGGFMPFPGWSPFLPAIAALAAVYFVFACWVMLSRKPIFLDDPPPPQTNDP
jgi:hypothetical protein